MESSKASVPAICSMLMTLLHVRDYVCHIRFYAHRLAPKLSRHQISKNIYKKK